MANKHRLILLGALLALVIVALVVTGLVPAFVGPLDAGARDALESLSSKLEGALGPLLLWLADAANIERRRQNPDIPAISDDI